MSNSSDVSMGTTRPPAISVTSSPTGESRPLLVGSSQSLPIPNRDESGYLSSSPGAGLGDNMSPSNTHFRTERKALGAGDFPSDETLKTNTEIKNKWEAAALGGIVYATPVSMNDNDDIETVGGNEHHKLNQLQSTSIAGNDITGSCLYSSGLVMQAAGRMAPVCITLVAAVLWLFRAVYSEVGSALPLNGGTYNALLNTSTKSVASLAACLTILSYTATAVVSAASAADYIALEVDINRMAVAIFLLGIFAVLTIMGITDSANVATGIFIAHLCTLLCVLVAAIVYTFNDGFSMFSQNWQDSSIFGSPQGNIGKDLFYGFGSAMLGVTGFETSSNYIEEQKPGVFPKTLRNMWYAVSFFNPMLCLFAMGVFPLERVRDDDFANSLLAQIAQHASGRALRMILVIDAAIVLAGGVLTSYVGIVGLMRRLALDRCLPHFLLQTNKFRGTNHYIILTFFLVTTSLRLMVSDMNTLGGVYGIAFLCVMSMFTIANMLMKYKRNKLPRKPIASYPHVVTAFVCVMAGLVANVTKSTATVAWFLLYATVTIIIVIGMFSRVQVLRFMSYLLSGKALKYNFVAQLVTKIQLTVKSIRTIPLMFFAKKASLPILNKAIMYVVDNEDTNCVRIVHVYQDRQGSAEEIKAFEEAVSILDRMYPKMTIELYLVEGEFCPGLVDKLAGQFGVPKNFMFMCCPGDKFPHHIGTFGGVRVITH